MTDPPDSVMPPAGDIDRMEGALGRAPRQFRPGTVGRPAAGTAARWIVADGHGPSPGVRSAFVKIGATDITADWFRAEWRNYATLLGWFLPQVRGFDDDGDRPALAPEDLSAADWPPPWTDGRCAAHLDALAAILRTRPPADLVHGSLEPAA